MAKMMLIAIAALAAIGCASNSPQGSAEAPLKASQKVATVANPADMINDGRNIAEAQCAGCHAVGSYGESPNPAAPTFRTVLGRYPADLLEEDLLSGIQVAHPMPDFQFNPVGVDSLIAYLKSIQEPS